MIKVAFNATTVEPASLSLAGDSAWVAEEWRLETVRGAPGQAVECELSADDVLELELADGTCLLLADDQLASYGFEPKRSGAAIEIGASLRPSDALSRDGAGAWVLRALRLWRNPAGAGVYALAGTAQDMQLQNLHGWYRFGVGAVPLAHEPREPLKPLESITASEGPMLLLVHGTISSTAGSFGGLLESSSWRRLRARYGDHVYGYEHRTLTESPLDNALAMVEALPAGQVVDIVTHSRGGLVAELLVRAAESPGGNFDKEELEGFEVRLNPTVAEETIKKLEQLQSRMRDKAIKIRRLVRVAAPMRGTTLLSGRPDRWVASSFNLAQRALSLSGRPDAAAVVGAIKAFVLELTRQREVPTVLPGLEAMRPESAWIALLNPSDPIRTAVPTFVIAGDYVGKGIFSWLADRFTDAFYGGGNDWVVNTASMTGGAVRAGGIQHALFRDADTTHTSYFNRDLVRERILDALERGTEASGFVRVERETTDIARGGRKTKEKPGAPIAFLLPGISGSHLQRGRSRIWFRPHRLVLGNLRKLAIDASDVSPDGWIDSAYERFSEFLTSTHEVRPYSYDWRMSIADTGTAFAKLLADALDEAARRKQPVHVFAHSMGGLVARYALSQDNLWNRLQDRTGSRLIMLGTPNGGSHSIPWLLMGQEKTLRMLARWDLRNDRRSLVDMFRRYPGMLELMPFGNWSERNFFDPAYWQDVAQRLAQGSKNWPVPEADSLDQAERVLSRIAKDPLAGKPVVYVAGYNPKDGTIDTITHDDGAASPARRSVVVGDGRVLWRSGIPDGVTTYYATEVHGDLAKARRNFNAYLELAMQGRSAQLSTAPPASSAGVAATSRGEMRFAAADDLAGETLLLYPTEEELIAAAMGGHPDQEFSEERLEVPRVRVCVIHGSFVAARGPILFGRYENDTELHGVLSVLDGLLGGVLQSALTLNCLPNNIGEVHLSAPSARSNPLGAIIVGLGRVGELSPVGLQETLRRGLFELALRRATVADDQELEPIDVCSVLVGSGSYGLSIDAAAGALLQAVHQVQRSLAEVSDDRNRLPRIGCLRLFEIDEARAEEIAAALVRLIANDSQLSIVFDGRVASGEQGLRTHLKGLAASDSAQRIVIRAPQGIEFGFEFTVITRSARSDFVREPAQGRFVQRMVELATDSTADVSGLSRALFELITPNDYKPLLGNVERLVLNVDERAATVPWELMRDDDESGEPLAVRIRMVRQLVRSPRRGAVPVLGNRALLIGDTDTGGRYPKLDGAREEMRAVKRLLELQTVRVDAHEGVAALKLLEDLLTQDYRILHIAAHGDWVSIGKDGSIHSKADRQVIQRAAAQLGSDHRVDQGERISGVVLSDGLLLTSRQIAKLPRVPELVFLNCCHLGDTSGDGNGRSTPWPELAASLAIAFIDRGAKVVVAAGWAVNDRAAQTFAEYFYRGLLRGDDLSTAVRDARRETFQQHPHHNTWGAYQVYGDDQYCLKLNTQQTSDKPPPVSPITTRLVALDEIAAMKGRAQYRDKLEVSHPESKLPREEDPGTLLARLSPELLADAEVRAAMGRTFQEMRRRAEAIEHLSAALALNDALLTVKDVEQLANLETREAAARAQTLVEVASNDEESRVKSRHALASCRSLLQRGQGRIKDLTAAMGETVERLSLIGSAYKREAWLGASEAQADKLQGRRPLTALADAIKSYDDATTLGVDTHGDPDHYPANNLAQLLWLHAALEGKADTATSDKISQLAQGASANAQRRCEAGGSFWEHAASIDSALSQALADELARPPTKPNDSTAIADRLIAAVNVAREDIRRRFGNDYKNASPKEQLQFFIAMFKWRAAGRSSAAASAGAYVDAFSALMQEFARAQNQQVRGPAGLATRPSTAQESNADIAANGGAAKRMTGRKGGDPKLPVKKNRGPRHQI